MSRAARLLLLLALAAFAMRAASAVAGARPRKPLTVADVEAMAHAGIPDAAIIAGIRNSHSVFHLEVREMIDLKRHGVSDEVLAAMVSTEVGAAPALPVVTPTPAGEAALTPTAVTLVGSSGTLSEAAALFRDRKWSEASQRLFLLIRRGQVGASELPEADEHLADCLYEMGLHQSAYDVYLDALHQGTGTAAFGPTLMRLMQLSTELHDERSLLRELQNIQPAVVPAEPRRDLGYFYGRLYFLRLAPDDARRALFSVTEDSPYYFRARFTEGVVDALDDRFPDALVSFRRITDACAPAAGASAAPPADLCDRAWLATGQTLYSEGFGGNPATAGAFAKVRDGSRWHHAAELGDAWALYRIGRNRDALEKIAVVDSEGTYQPELAILKAIIFYRMCMDDQVVETLDRFDERYQPIEKAVDALVQAEAGKQSDAYAAFEAARARPGERPDWPAGVVEAIAESDGRIESVRDHLHAIDDELAQLERAGAWRDASVGLFCREQLTGHRVSLQKLAGAFVLIDLQYQDDALRDLLGRQSTTIRRELTLDRDYPWRCGPFVLGSSGALQAGGVQVRRPLDRIRWPDGGDEAWKHEPFGD